MTQGAAEVELHILPLPSMLLVQQDSCNKNILNGVRYGVDLNRQGDVGRMIYQHTTSMLVASALAEHQHAYVCYATVNLVVDHELFTRRVRR